MNKIKYKAFLSFLKLILGIIFGLSLGYIIRTHRHKFNNISLYSKLKNDNDHHINIIQKNTIIPDIDNIYDESSLLTIDYNDYNERQNKNNEKQILPKNKHIFVGVMTTKAFLLSRAKSAYETWVGSIPGKVVFFSSEDSQDNARRASLPKESVVSLTGVDDTYPPQKKSFLLLKYMHDVYLNDYEWFMRADDDIYIKGHQLSIFLRSINSSQPQFIGQSGQGNKKEFDKLNLDGKSNYCMGGPGMIFSRETLKLVVPHIQKCLDNLYTTHEDVEIGRCVKMFAKVDCTWAFQMHNLFYHNLKENYTNNLNKIQLKEALTLHPIKESRKLAHVHRHFLSDELMQKLRRNQLYLNEIIRVENNTGNATLMQNSKSSIRYSSNASLTKYGRGGSDFSWKFFNKYLYSISTLKAPLDKSSKIAIYSITNQVMKMINGDTLKKGRAMTFKEMYYGYRTVDPLYGAAYVLDIKMSYMKFDSRSTEQSKRILVRRHTYVEQPFMEPHCIEQDKLFDDNYMNIDQRPNSNSSLNFILPLIGRFDKLLKFIHYLKKAVLEYQDTEITLAIMLYQDDNQYNTKSHSENTKQLMNDLSLEFPFHKFHIEMMRGEFSRALALTTGSKLFPSEALLVFIDVDIAISRQAIRRLLFNTIRGRNLYYPIVFSRYSDQIACKGYNEQECSDKFILSENFGYWRKFGFGIVSLYNSDFKTIGGFDLSIKGWGKEDVDLFRKFAASGRYETIRCNDPGLIHLFHKQTCKSNLSPIQMEMCKCSKASTYASLSSLAESAYSSLRSTTKLIPIH